MTKLKLVVLLLISVVLASLARPLISQQALQVSYVAQFSLSDLSFDKRMEFDMVTLKQGDFLTDLGKPMLPSREMRIALPAGMAVKSVRVADTESQEVFGEYNIYPAQPPIEIGAPQKGSDFVEPDRETYASSQPYPSKLVEFAGQADLAGQGIASLRLYPLQYIPGQKKLILYTSITVVLEGAGGYECKDYLSPNITERNRQIYEQMIKDMVVNPEDVELRTGLRPVTSLPPPGGPFDHVIITSASFAPEFQPLVAWHTKKGVKDTTITTDWIYGNYGGSTNQEKIRNFVIDAHSTWGAIYFLMGGEHETVPFEYRNYIGENTPSDQYYSDFDDDWEHEVFVGRVTVATTLDVTRFVDKVLKYEKDPPRTNYPLDVLLIGMDLDKVCTRAEFLKDSIDTYIPGYFNVTKVYDSNDGDHKDSVIHYLNAGQNLVNHSDHSDFQSWGTGDEWHDSSMSVSEVLGLNNDDQMSVIVSQGCKANGMDYNDCVSEYFVIYNINEGGVAFTGNTRSGKTQECNPCALSGKLDLEWWIGLFSRNVYNIGQTLVDSKHHFSTSDSTSMHCEWQFNLLGEPEMPIWTDEPSTFAVTHPWTLPAGASSFSVYVQDSITHVPVESAYVCLWKGQEVYVTGYTDASGNALLNPSPSSLGIMYVTVTKHNYIPYEGEAGVGNAIVLTVPAVNVEESTATIQGYLESDGGFPTTCWLLWDIDSGEPYAHSESLGVIGSGSPFSQNITDTAEGELYYFKAKAKNLAGWAEGEEICFLTKPLPPRSFTARAVRCTTIYLEWEKPKSADRTIIERDTIPTWATGVEIYDRTGFRTEDSGLDTMRQYYYRAWSYCSEGTLYQYSDEYDSTDATTPDTSFIVCGDICGNGLDLISLVDIVCFINWLFKSGPPPTECDDPYTSCADCNGDDKVDLADIVCLINYVLKGGPAPIC